MESGKDISDEPRVEFEEYLRGNHSALPVENITISNWGNRGGIEDLSLTNTLLQRCQ